VAGFAYATCALADSRSTSACVSFSVAAICEHCVVLAAAGSGDPEANASIGRLAALARPAHAKLVAAGSPRIVHVSLPRSSHPAAWGRVREGLLLSTPGRLTAAFELPRAGVWDVWLQGQIMPTVGVSVDGHAIASIGAQLGGNSLVLNTMTPVPVSLSAGRHRLSVARGGFTLAPGEGGSAALYGLFLTPASAAAKQPLYVVPPARWHALCGRSYQWIEVVPS